MRSVAGRGDRCRKPPVRSAELHLSQPLLPSRPTRHAGDRGVRHARARLPARAGDSELGSQPRAVQVSLPRTRAHRPSTLCGRLPRLRALDDRAVPRPKYSRALRHRDDYGTDPAFGPPDFQAYVEVYLGHRWYIFDPSGTAIPMGFVRFGTGRDAADVAFATIFGNVASMAPIIRTLAIQDESLGLVLPHHCAEALSTDDCDEAASSSEFEPVLCSSTRSTLLRPGVAGALESSTAVSLMPGAGSSRRR